MNLATDFDRSKLWDFTFLRWLAPDLLDGFSIGRYEEKRESFDLFAAKFERERCDFPGENRSRAGALQTKDSSLRGIQRQFSGKYLFGRRFEN